MKGPVRRFWRRRIAAGWQGGRRLPATRRQFWNNPDFNWERGMNSTQFWSRLATRTHSDEELWALRYRLRRELIEFARATHGVAGAETRAPDGFYCSSISFSSRTRLTIGFARRVRGRTSAAPLIFQQLENIVRLANDKDKPIQFILRVKAHSAGRRRPNEYIQHIIHLASTATCRVTWCSFEN